MLTRIFEGKVITPILITGNFALCTLLFPLKKKCEQYWPDNADSAFVPAPGSALRIQFHSVFQFAEFVIRKMVVTHVSL